MTILEKNVKIDTEIKRMIGVKKMRLHFHGADYDRKSMHIPSVDQEVRGKYRGVNVSIHQRLVKKRHDQTHNKMTYRGVTYIHEQSYK